MAGRAVMTTSMSRATMKNATDVSPSVQGREPERGPALEAGAVLIGFAGITSSCVFMVTPFDPSPEPRADLLRAGTGTASTLCNEAQAPTAEMAVAPPSIRKSAPTTYAESSDARYTASFAISNGSANRLLRLLV